MKHHFLVKLIPPRHPFSVRLGLVLTAGIFEEFLFRGFAIEELANWTGSTRLGAFLAWIAFVFAHLGRYVIHKRPSHPRHCR